MVSTFISASVANNIPGFEASSSSFENFLEKIEAINHVRSELSNELYIIDQFLPHNTEESRLNVIKVVARIKQNFKRLNHIFDEFLPNLDMSYDDAKNEMGQHGHQNIDFISNGYKQKRNLKKSAQYANSLEYLKKFYNQNVPVIRNGK